MTFKKYFSNLESFEGLDYEQSLELLKAFENDEIDLKALGAVAEEIRQMHIGNKMDLCSIMNVKSGSCSEDCRFCAQSAHYEAPSEHFDLKSHEEILIEAKKMEASGVNKFSLVSSGGYLDKEDIDHLTRAYDTLQRETELSLCASHGILSGDQAQALKNSGVKRYHHNLESSRSFYSKVCTTHSYDERIETIKHAQKSGMEVCCGGIFGLGEIMKDRIDMAYEIKKLGVQSVPINVLNPIPGTPFEKNAAQSEKSLLFMTILFRLILPKAEIRFAGGRNKLGKTAEVAFKSGVNGVLTGDFLTTTGTNIESDRDLFEKLGFEIKRKRG